MFDFCFICFYLTLVKLFFLSDKRPFYDTYLTYIVYNDFFDHSSLCFLFSFLYMFLQSCISSPKYSNKPTSSFNFCFLFIWIKVTFFLYQHSKSKEDSRNILMLYSMYPFYENYSTF